MVHTVYWDIYPTVSQPASLYGLPKLHKDKDSRSTGPPYRARSGTHCRLLVHPINVNCKQTTGK